MSPILRPSLVAALAVGAALAAGCTRRPVAVTPIDLCDAELPARVALLPVSDELLGPVATLESLGLRLDPSGANDTVELHQAYAIGGDGTTSFVALESDGPGIARDVHLALDTARGWVASGSLGTILEDRSGSSYTELVDGYVGIIARRVAPIPVIVVRIERGTSVSAGCDPREEIAGEYFRLCAIADTLDCFAEITGSTHPYDRDVLPSPAEALGQCEDVTPRPMVVPDYLPDAVVGFVDVGTMQIQSREGGVQRFTLAALHARARNCVRPAAE